MLADTTAGREFTPDFLCLSSALDMLRANARKLSMCFTTALGHAYLLISGIHGFKSNTGECGKFIWAVDNMMIIQLFNQKHELFLTKHTSYF